VLRVEELPTRLVLAKMRNDWDEFESATAYPGNASVYGDYYASELLSRPLFLEAYDGTTKVAQWLLYLRRTPQSRFRLIAGAFCGPQLRKETSLPYEEVFAPFVAHVLNKHRPSNFHLLSYALVRGVSETALRQSRFSIIEEYYSYVNRLTNDPGLIEQFGSTRRYELRKALKAGYEYRIGIPVGDYHDLSVISYRRSGMRGPLYRTLKRIDRCLVAQGLAFLSGVYVEDKLNAASIIVHRGTTAYYLYGASADNKAPGATTYLQYENMRHARGLGLAQYDFGGARLIHDKARSLSEFKRQFGGECITCYGGVYR
jgi:hypothetical protein